MIQVDNLSFSYGKVNVLEGISLRLEEGKIYGLLGENGVGKTTLLGLLTGIKKPKSGSILTDSYVPYKRNPEFLADQYYLADTVAALHEKAANWALNTGKFWPRYSHEKFLNLMKDFETDPDSYMDRMSLGQLKKTYISFALSCGAKYIFMDEPTNGLDIPSKSQFRSAISKYTLEESTVVISTHQVRDLENIIDPIIILDKQAVLLNASLEEIAGKLYFDYGTTLNPASLYTEQLPGGAIQVYPNLTGEESNVNIEALFNTVHKHKSIIKEMFK